MDSSNKANLINHKWLLCTLASFLGFLLCLYLKQNYQLRAILSSSLPFSNLSSIELPPPSYVAAEPSAAPYSKGQESHTSSPTGSGSEGEKCDIFDGRWVYDPKAYPLYDWHRCPFLDAQVNCQKNGRPDSGYEHWRWEARGCQIPRFNGSHMVERLRGKRVAIIGDSLNRNQWESLSCLLYPSLRPSRVTVRAYGNDMVFRSMDYNFSLEFFWSPFLVRLEERRDRSTVLKVGELPSSAPKWRGADVMVFNTGHWWTHTGRMRSWKYFEMNGKLVEEMESSAAFETALSTWARWVDRHVDYTRTTVFFRSFSPEHKRENLHWCYNQTRPMPANETYVQGFPKSISSAIERTIRRMKTPVRFLNITRLSEYRRDAHTSVYTVRQWKLLTEEERKQPEAYADCSHWCLPGLPDTWNVLLYASLFGDPSGLPYIF
ncbi:protein trichome birefringence-like 42 [Iris pallida]|uniref:Protein trichome birefringence-like 42 n=1 Tax=Iris pallida TaxID=29817 RepID=A0AAX6HNF9_IRIPA|nr:protein trichome birefringence-like 42 [Iris pallida]